MNRLVLCEITFLTAGRFPGCQERDEIILRAQQDCFSLRFADGIEWATAHLRAAKQ
jgi:hypothetical protein